jgi:tetratricopeptide (TPR) repeat protein
MTDALITDLSKVGSLKLISRQTAMKYKGSNKGLKQIARELNVDAVVGGSVVREAGVVRVTAHLIDAATDENLWAERYERELTSILALQREVARAIAGKVKVTLGPEENARLTRVRQVNPETYEAYLRGMFWLNKGSPEGVQKGLAYFDEAVEKDPADPLAYAGLALAYERTVHGPNPPEGALSRARAAAETALRLDDTLAEVHTALGIMQSFRDWQWEKALRSFERALEINPNMAFAYFFRAYIHCFFGRIEEAIADIKQAQEVDPLTLEYAYGADFYRMLGRYEEAIAVGQKAVDLNPKAPFGHVALAWTYSDQGKHQESLAAYKKAADAAPPFKWYAAVGYSKAGRPEEVKKLLDELKQEKVDGWTAYWFVSLNAMAGNKDEAFRWLSYEPHHDWIPYCRVGDEFKNLRGDPRFAAALKRMNLPPI